LTGLVAKHCGQDARILEIGCNAGRNLSYLQRAGYENLTGIEISQQAVDLMRERFPEVARRARILVGPVEQHIRAFADGEFDLVFTVAVLEHIHTESEWIFADMARVTRTHLITLEDEAERSWRHFPRDYQRVFAPLGLAQLESFTCSIETHGLNRNFRGRMFRKKPASKEPPP
jgi:SAM-dependent methyltransferase